MHRKFAQPVAAVALAILVGSTVVVQSNSPASATEASDSIAVDVDASVAISKGEVELQGPVSDFDVSLPDAAADSELKASIAEEGAGAELTLSYATPSEAVLETQVDDDVKIEVVENDEGEQSVMFTDTEGELVGGIAFEKARAADGNLVRPQLAVDGKKIVQSFAGEKGEAVGPIAVDAYASTVWYKRGWVTKKSGKKYIVNVDPTKLGRKQIAWNTHKTHVKHAKKVLGAANTKKYWNYNIEQQFVCHVVGAWFPSGVYNMESWQPSLPWGAIANPIDRCNRKKK